MSSPTSLRDLYAPPPHSWSFSAPPMNSSDSNIPQAASTSYQWSTRPSSNRLLDLSGTIEDDEGIDVKALMMGLVTSALSQYATSAVAIPWEVGKTLLQVQWIPRDIDSVPVREYVREQEEEEEVRMHVTIERTESLTFVLNVLLGG